MTALRTDLSICLMLAPLFLIAALSRGPDIAVWLDDGRVAIAGDTPSVVDLPNIQLKPEN